jgi:hypothetical protein
MGLNVTTLPNKPHAPDLVNSPGDGRVRMDEG